MLHQFLNFPHIAEAIIESFTFRDLLHSALVNHTWNDIVSPVLYLDLITFRLKYIQYAYPKPHISFFFTEPKGRQGLHKHARHIRAVTCKGTDSLQALVEARCSRLLEVNYVSERQDRELEYLAQLVSQNPDLCAVSIENFHTRKEGQLEQLQAFVTFLDDYPMITCFYLDGRWFSNMKGIRALRGGLSRAGSRHYWPGREKPIMAENSRGLEDKWSHGRFDHQSIRNVGNAERLAVLARGEVLEVTSKTISPTACLARFPFVHQIRVSRGLSLSLPELKRCSQLREIELKNPANSATDVFNFLTNHLPETLSALHWDVYHEIQVSQIAEAFPPRSSSGSLGPQPDPSSVLVSLTFCEIISMQSLLQFLSTCPNLQVLSAKWTFVEGSGPPGDFPEVSPQWASRKLKKLRVGFMLEGHPNDIDFERVQDPVKARGLVLASKIAPSFMEQLGNQNDLHDLELSFNAAYRCGTSPFLQLVVGPVNGLDQLSKLSRLEYFSVTGLLHEVGSTEIAWMARHWPQLKKIQLPIFDPQRKTELATDWDYKELTPDYRGWFPSSLEVVKICGRHYTCPDCDEFPDFCSCSED
ncbi:hypothetical protein CPB97_006137 [Podila verticillata]|nr:hypothetical protein CPB97_006137 [Podila verticillata]